ncbi:hypothetical protein CHS0354_043106 [Potamilus streckersoni]|uniref:RanBD1 domain-containing protein n=1 Tax=Potamilus streckersoni TaxID=2493646 RepID=A0AAE0RMI7_9BIVA|nr:hypothetical protein CHS0354_043106 [Potamilus streckersoni]
MADDKDEIVESPDIHFEPLVKLPEVEIKTLEDEEDTLVEIRAKLFRFDKTMDPPEWKERGTGDVKILKHKETGYIRVLMRRDKTLKICANHYVTPQMELLPNCGSDRTWVWNTLADFADEEARPELLAIRFINAENAQKFKKAFDEGKDLMAKVLTSKVNGVTSPGKEDKSSTKEDKEKSSLDADTDSVADKLQTLTVDGKTEESSGKNSDTENSDSEERTDSDTEEQK